MKQALPQPSKRTWLERQGFFYRVDTALEHLAGEGFCVVMDTGGKRPPARHTTNLIGFPDYRLRLEQRWCFPVRFTIEQQVADAAGVWHATRMFVSYNVHGISNFLLRTRFEKLAPVEPPRVPFPRKSANNRHR